MAAPFESTVNPFVHEDVTPTPFEKPGSVGVPPGAHKRRTKRRHQNLQYELQLLSFDKTRLGSLRKPIHK